MLLNVSEWVPSLTPVILTFCRLKECLDRDSSIKSNVAKEELIIALFSQLSELGLQNCLKLSLQRKVVSQPYIPYRRNLEYKQVPTALRTAIISSSLAASLFMMVSLSRHSLSLQKAKKECTLQYHWPTSCCLKSRQSSSTDIRPR